MRKVFVFKLENIWLIYVWWIVITSDVSLGLKQSYQTTPCRPPDHQIYQTFSSWI